MTIATTPVALLKDVLEPKLDIVFCGTAAGHVSAELNAYYAHSNNKFWKTLAETGLTDRRMWPCEFEKLVKFGIGLTDLCKDAAGSDREIKPTISHNEHLKQKIETFQPRFVAFTSAEAGKRYLRRKVTFGEQTEKIGRTRIWVLPSTSQMAGWNWTENKSYWQDLADAAVKARAHKPS